MGRVTAGAAWPRCPTRRLTQPRRATEDRRASSRQPRIRNGNSANGLTAALRNTALPTQNLASAQCTTSPRAARNPICQHSFILPGSPVTGNAKGGNGGNGRYPQCASALFQGIAGDPQGGSRCNSQLGLVLVLPE